MKDESKEMTMENLIKKYENDMRRYAKKEAKMNKM